MAVITEQTAKEDAFYHCACIILADQCPPERDHYLCMKQEDFIGDCTQCWNNYLWGIFTGSIEPCKAKRNIVGVRA